jgi:hypothetical protein
MISPTLLRAAEIWGRVLALCGLTLTGVWVAGRLAGFVPTAAVPPSLCAPIILLAGSLFAVGLSRPDDATLSARAAASAAVTAAVGFLTSLAVLSGSRAGAAPVAIVAVFVGAFIEEWLFRLLLPAVLRRSLARGRCEARSAPLAAAALAQASFAAAHLFLNPGAVASAGRESLRLFLAGLIYCRLVVTLGLPFAVAVHATLNSELLFGARAASSPGWLLMLGVAAAMPLLTASWSPRRIRA